MNKRYLRLKFLIVPATKRRGYVVQEFILTDEVHSLVRSNKKNMYYHYIFGTYKGKFSLIDKEIKTFLTNEFKSIADERSLNIIAFSILEDHIHMLIKQADTDKTEYVMRMIKGISSRKLFQKFKTNRLEYRKLWSRGYYARKISDHEVQTVIDYINNQVDKDGIDKRYNRRGLLVGSQNSAGATQ